MATRRAWQRALGGLLVAIPGCLGGQTGQPDSISGCPEPTVGTVTAGVTPELFMATFAGAHVESLVWSSPDAPLDVITLEVRADTDGGGTDDCGDFEIPVRVEISTRDQGLLASSTAILMGAAGQRERARMEGRGQRVTFDVILTVVEGEVRISGSFRHGDPELPGGGDATFPDPNAPRPAAGGG